MILVLLSHLIFNVPRSMFPCRPHPKTLLPILYLFLSTITLYSATCFSSLLLKNALPAILCIPFILIFGIFLVTPLFLVSVLISPHSSIFVFSIFSAIQAVFLILSFITWQKAIVKDNRSLKTVFVTSIVILTCPFGIHAIANFMANKLNRTIQQAKAQGFKITPEEITALVKDEGNAAFVYHEAFEFAMC